MTVPEFVQWSQGYYGPWPDGMKADIRDYLVELSPAYLDMLKSVCKEKVPSRIGQVNGYPPDIAKMQELAEDVGRRLDREESRRIEEREWKRLESGYRALPSPGEEVIDIRGDWAAALARALSKARVR